MEIGKQNKNRIMGVSKKAAKIAGLFVLAASLYSGDRADFEGDIWAGDKNALEVKFTSAGRAVAIPPAGELSVATYNIKYGHIDREGVVKTARSLGASVLGLTEAGPNVARQIAGDEYEIIRGGAGNIMLSSLPVKESFSEELPSEHGRSPRTALFAKLQVGEHDMWFVLTHLTNDEWPDSSESIRLEQLNALNKIIDERLQGGAIVLGDFNFEPDTPEFRLMDDQYDDGLTELGLGNMGTFRGGLGQKRLDYMFIDEGLGYGAIAGGRDGSDASDHLPIIMVLAPSGGHGPLPAVIE
jgi:endonuclease/exonuclease/phosphatase family metal-dependent hydrolase